MAREDSFWLGKPKFGDPYAAAPRPNPLATHFNF